MQCQEQDDLEHKLTVSSRINNDLHLLHSEVKTIWGFEELRFCQYKHCIMTHGGDSVSMIHCEIQLQTEVVEWICFISDDDVLSSLAHEVV